jgi:hypothetical protein
MLSMGNDRLIVFITRILLAILLMMLVLTVLVQANPAHAFPAGIMVSMFILATRSYMESSLIAMPGKASHPPFSTSMPLAYGLGEVHAGACGSLN